MAHYFTNENLKSCLKKNKVIINKKEFTFFTDNGVFSKKGLDFGTRSLLESIPEKILNGDILDFGCGYGPIGIYAAKVGNATVDMVDINKRSLALAKKNSLINDVKTNVFESNIYDSISKKYDLIITNPPIRVGKDILYKILFEAKRHLKKKGELWLVVNKDQGAKSLLKDLQQEYTIELINKNKGFYIIMAQND